MKRKIISLLVLSVLLLITWYVVVNLYKKNYYLENYKLVKIGMTQKEVEAILGKPDGTSSTGYDYLLYYHSEFFTSKNLDIFFSKSDSLVIVISPPI